MSRRVTRRLLLSAMAAGLARPALAQSFPARAVTIVVPFAPGGASDIVGRIIARGLQTQLGHPVVVENVAGAGGSIGTVRVARAPADGYMLTLGHIGTLAANVPLYPNLGYDPRRDFAPIGLVVRNPAMLGVSLRSGVRDLRGFIEHVRAKQGEATFGTAGSGSQTHLAAALFLNLTGLRGTIVAYRGSGPAVQDLAAGTIDAVMEQTLTLIPAHRSGIIRALAVTTRQRIEQVPDVPTFAEAGLPAFDAGNWQALAAPRGTPEPVVARLVAALSAAQDDPEVQQRFRDLAAEIPAPADRGPAFLARHIDAEVTRWIRIVREANITVD
ncbi:Bug family tripartite tricarboxylate transporter substrate binding protein [Falsiroseomonas sp. CW058]|uniref:Bug family tripartite tricarboxylate transporter substrate binding protein n=1 Tax=Falsiroseomonas sp. CW058 TaxID=3388664 RepID=UPI003D30F0E4